MEQPTYALGNSTLTDALFESVRSRIVHGLITPGEKVTEARLASEYGVARPTAKACIERLVVGGLLRRAAHKAAFVPVLTPSDVTDIYIGRLALERSAVEILARHERVPEEAIAAQRALVRAAEDGNFAEQAAADARFHAALVAGSASPRLERMHSIISGEVALTMSLHAAHTTKSAKSVELEHQAILDALLLGDRAAAVAAIERHLGEAESRVVARFS